MKKKETKPVVTKIEINEKTKEPKLVEVYLDKAYNDVHKKEPEIKKADFFEGKDPKKFGEQVIMPQVLGIKKQDDGVGKRQRIIKNIFVVLFIIFVTVVLGYTFYNDFFVRGSEMPSGEELLKILTNGWIYLICALLSLLFCFVFKALKLSVSCKSLTGKFHFRTCLETATIGHYYNAVTPLAVGGQPFEIYHLSKHGIHGGVASALPITTYILNQFAFVITGIIFLVLFGTNALQIPEKLLASFPTTFRILAVAGMICCALLPSLVLIFSLTPRFGAKVISWAVNFGGKLHIVKNPKETSYKTIKNIYHNTHCLKIAFTKPLSAITCFLLSFLEVLASSSIAYFSLKMFGYPTFASQGGILEWLQVCQLSILLSLAVSFVPTPGNAGAADLGFYMLFTVGLAGGLAFPAMAFWRTCSFYSYIIIGFIFATLKKSADKKKEAKLNAPL